MNMEKRLKITDGRLQYKKSTEDHERAISEEANLRNLLLSANSDIQSLRDQLSQREKEIEELKEQLKQRDEQIKTLHEAVKLRDDKYPGEIKQLKEALKEVLDSNRETMQYVHACRKARKLLL